MTTVISDHQLDAECTEIAADIFAEAIGAMPSDETPEDMRDNMMERAQEAADGHQWVIYTHYALSICAHCNTDIGEEFVDDVGAPSPFSLASAASMIVYGEMRGRIEEELSRLIDDWEDTRQDDA